MKSERCEIDEFEELFAFSPLSKHEEGRGVKYFSAPPPTTREKLAAADPSAAAA
jgi:hypothetical protein